ncbi:Protein of unknown function [Paraoerskovia marina]|uniref:DUF3866 domain-containing protein n=1 Tax=Paraoerskovia marina TaxID=545619 RepID=A0A1H1SXB7_9CELL|nr:Protein of unknown function [Paraoerskovia marina]
MRVITWRSGTVVSHGKSWTGAQELRVDLHDAAHDPALPDHVRALAYTDVVGTPAVGDRVTLNVSALARGLGTGGYALVVASPDALPPDPAPGPGHLVKARYTPLQTLVLGADEQESDHHALLADADDLAALPVVVADLHSAVPAVVAGARHGAALAGRPAPRVVYVMPDGGALPVAFSRTVSALRDADWLTSCITVGQAYGGDHEAVTVHTGLLTAHLVEHADLVVLAQGPGNLGTGTRWGFSGVQAGEALNAAGVLGGHPVASLRVSGADARDRHRGISHHSLTTYGRVATSPADVPVPARTPQTPAGAWDADLDARVRDQARALAAPHGRHRLVDVPVEPALLEALADCPVRLSTMGRGLHEDPASFVAAAAAGVHAEQVACRR